MQASLRLLDYMPRVAELVSRFRSRLLDQRESQQFSEQAVLLRSPTLAEALEFAGFTVARPQEPLCGGSD
jgi:hypothetical protein